MHPAHAIEAALAYAPPNIHELVASDFLRQAGLNPEVVSNSPEGQKALGIVERSLAASPSASARRLEGRHGWDLTWSSGWYFLYGHVFASPEGRLDETSPVLLVNRQSLQSFYGKELMIPARRILGDSLVWHERNGEPWM